MNTRLGLIVSLGILAAVAGAQTKSDYFPDTPKNHWVYVDIADLQSVGVLVGFRDGLGYGVRAQSRYEMAASAYSAYVRFHLVLGELKTRNQSISINQFTTPNHDEEVRDLKSNVTPLQTSVGRIAKDLVDLITEFSTELKALGTEPSLLDGAVRRDRDMIVSFRFAKPGEALHQFPDVPADHWAADATRNLRAEGILHGYPDGSFRG